MSEPPPSPHDDLQRPLDEGRPEAVGPVAEAPPAAAVSPPDGAADPVSGTDIDAPHPGADSDGDAPHGDTDGPDAAEGGPDGSGDDPPAAADATTGSTRLRPAVPAAGAAPVRPHRAAGPFALAVRGRLGPAVAALRRGARALPRLAGRAARGLSGWARRPSGRLALPGTAITVLVGGAVVAGAVVVPATGAEVGARSSGAATPTGSGTPVPTGPTLPVPPDTSPRAELPADPADNLREWADGVADRTGIPPVAVLAYGYAELVLVNTNPECNLTWTTLAAIGRVESNHGHTGDATLLPDGRALPPITGDPLDGEGDRQLIPDTDGGDLDGDEQYDRAVGPMQFIPETWRTEAVDATGDGVADVHNIHDAALAAGNYLCRAGRDLTTPGDWWEAIHAYNDVSAYADAVFAAANEYGERSRDG